MSNSEATVRRPVERPQRLGLPGRVGGLSLWTGANRLAIAAALIVPILLVSEQWQFTFTTALVYALAATCVSVLLGQAGMISLLTTALMGLGGLVCADVANHGGSWYVGLAVAAAACGLVGALVGVAGARLRGMTFGIVTLTASLAASAILFHDAILGADPAFGVVVQRPSFPHLNLYGNKDYYFFCLGIALIAWLVVELHRRSRPGRTWRAIRENEVAALSVGVRVGVYRIWASALGSCVAGVAGVLLLTLQSQSNGQEFGPFPSLLLFTAAVAAGTRSFTGRLIAGGLIAILPALLGEWGISEKLLPLIFAGGVLISVRHPDGLVGLLSALARKLTRLERRGDGRA